MKYVMEATRRRILAPTGSCAWRLLLSNLLTMSVIHFRKILFIKCTRVDDQHC